jgi:hypothetical protein
MTDQVFHGDMLRLCWPSLQVFRDRVGHSKPCFGFEVRGGDTGQLLTRRSDTVRQSKLSFGFEIRDGCTTQLLTRRTQMDDTL